MLKSTKPKINMKLANFINKMKQQKEKIKQKIKQKKAKKNHSIMDLKEVKIIKRNDETEFEKEFGDLESISFEEYEHPIVPIYEIGDYSDDELEIGFCKHDMASQSALQ